MSDLLAGGRPDPDISETEDREQSPPASWIVAYAMGLIASDLHADGVDELVRAAGGEIAVLRAAIHHLEDGVVVGDGRLREEAVRLLEATVERARGISSADVDDEPERIVLLDP